MAVLHDVGHSKEERDVIGRMIIDRRVGHGAEWMILLTVTAVAGMELILLAWLVL